MTATMGLVTVAGTQDARADFRCTGTISNRTISDNVQVPSGSTCTLNNVRVDGNVRTGSNARLPSPRATSTATSRATTAARSSCNAPGSTAMSFPRADRAH